MFYLLNIWRIRLEHKDLSSRFIHQAYKAIMLYSLLLLLSRRWLLCCVNFFDSSFTCNFLSHCKQIYIARMLSTCLSEHFRQIRQLKIHLMIRNKFCWMQIKANFGRSAKISFVLHAYQIFTLIKALRPATCIKIFSETSRLSHNEQFTATVP